MLAERAAFGAPVSATDADEDTLTYTLGNILGRSDAQNFDIDAGTGQLRTKTRLEYEWKSIFYVVVSVSDGRGGSASIDVEIRVLDSLVTVPDQSTVERRVQVTAHKSTINEGEEVTFIFTSSEAAPAGGLDVFYSLKQLAVDDDAEAYDFRPLPLISTHHTAHVTIPESATTERVKFRTHPDQYEETDVLLVVSIGQRSISNFHGQSCHYEGDRNALTIESNPEGCWARVNVQDQGGDRRLRAPIPFARFESVFAGHDGYTGQNFQFIDPGEPVKFTISLSVPAPLGGLEVFFALYETSSDFVGTIPIYPTIDLRSVTIPEGESEALLEISTGEDDPLTDDCGNQVHIGEGCISARIFSAPYSRNSSGQLYRPYVHYPSALRYALTTYVRLPVVTPPEIDLPAVTIEADRTPITEGETASFTVSVSTPAPASGLVVDVALSEEGGGGFTHTLPETRTVTVPAGQSMASVSVPTIDDAVDEPDGAIVARVAEQATAYTVGDPGTAQVVVQDADLPMVVIEVDRTPIAKGEPALFTEGEIVSFTLTISIPAPEGGVYLDVVLSEEGGGDFTDTLPETRTVWVPPGKFTASVSVPTIDDSVDEPDGRIVARVQPRPGVFVVGDPGAAEVVVRDNDLPAVTITADRTPITEGETASFTVTLSDPAPAGGLVVEVALSGEGDFTHTLPETRPVTVSAGGWSALVRVETVDDLRDENDGKIVARVERAGHYALGNPGDAEVWVKDSDELAKDDPAVTIIEQVIPRVGRTVAGIVARAIDCRRYSRFAEDHVTVGGLEVQPRAHATEEGPIAMSHPDAAAWTRDGRRDETGMSADEVLQTSSFAMTAPDREDDTGMAWWAEGAVAGFTGRNEALAMHGNVVSGVSGVEHLARDRRSGIAVARSIGDVEYSLPSFGSGAAHSSLTSLHPYVCWFPSDDTWMWGMLGYGWGVTSLSGAVTVEDLDTSMRMGAFGITGELLTLESWELVWKASVFAVSMRIDETGVELPIRGDVFSFRGMVESAWEHEFESRAVLRSSFEVGGRYGGGDAETGGSLALGGGVRYTAPDERGLTAEVNGHGLAHHADTAFEDWGVDGKLRFYRRTGGRDLSLELELGHGSPGDAVRRFLEPDAAVPLQRGIPVDVGVRAGLRLIYGGLELGRLGNAELHGGLASGLHGSAVYMGGLSLARDDRFDFALEGVYGSEPRSERSLGLSLRLRW